MSGKDPQAVAAPSANLGSDAAMEKATGKKCIYMSISDIENHLKREGPGAHFVVGINRNPTPSGKAQAGHWFNAFYDGKNIYTIEGQAGQILEWPHDYGDISEWCALV